MVLYSCKRNNVLNNDLERIRKVFNSIDGIKESVDSQGRYSYNFLLSKKRKKQVAREIVSSGNGYVYGGFLKNEQYKLDPREFISIKDLSLRELEDLVNKVIISFSR